ncbi:MAG: quinolinate synthase NadA [Terriglobales bacterium]
MPLLAESKCDLDNYLRYPDHALDGRIADLKAQLGSRVLILGHHYQRDEVIRFADHQGDSLRLAQQCTLHPEAEFIVFCGVHFMAESADILRAPHQQVILPDLNAGCSMADMAEFPQVFDAWEQLQELGLAQQFLPITYMNSTARIKAFCGEHGGLVCTSSNAPAAFRWAFARKPKLLFLPDQHQGRNTAIKVGVPMEETLTWNPRQDCGGHSPEALASAKVLLWKGHCSVHQRFLPEHVDQWRAREPGIQILVHPECSHEVVAQADHVGSTDFIIRTLDAAAPGSHWAIGTELHLVHRLARLHPNLLISPLDNDGCPVCSTMFRISPPHLAWVLDNLVQGQVVNRVQVREEVRSSARLALDRMLALAPALRSAEREAGAGRTP